MLTGTCRFGNREWILPGLCRDRISKQELAAPKWRIMDREAATSCKQTRNPEGSAAKPVEALEVSDNMRIARDRLYFTEWRSVPDPRDELPAAAFCGLRRPRAESVVRQGG